MTPIKLASLIRKAALPAAAVLCFLVCGAAFAGDCNQDIGALTQKRQGVIDQLNALAQGGKKQLDPAASCPKLRALVAVERELLAYLTKNKDWCAVPDEAFRNISASADKTGKVASQACTIAEQMKKAQEQQASGALNAQQKLPSGPL
ncbi:MAG: hypothetical protein L0Y57_04475 [Beijerinckiaceae bacterium]|nr:hypothetical protein [Beijerinckiaceae bacterium]